MSETKKIIEFNGVKKSFDGKTFVIEDFTLDINEGEFVTFLGPSGCGKTTILRILGGFDIQTSGEILLDGKDLGTLPPNLRPINTVFQKYALFPHLNVYDNVAFGLKMKKLPKNEIDEKVGRALKIVDLEGFEKRSINTLSGGQQQRIAIARAIVNRPRVLLLDEPLSALDYKMRKEMQIELKNMHKMLGITFIFITHDQEEALTMSDKIVVMANGEIQQVGTPEEIYNEPANVFVADFIGESNIFVGVVEDKLKARFAGASFDCVDDFEVGTRVNVVIRPEDVEIAKDGKGQLVGEVTQADFKGTFYVTFVQCGQYEVEVHCLDYYEPGTKVGLHIDADMIHLIKQDVSINHYEGELTEIDGNGLITVKFADIIKKVNYKKVFEDATFADGILKNGTGANITVEGTKVEVSYQAADAVISDDINSGDVVGNIFEFYYVGDHYSYHVGSDTEEEYVVDDEDLWNDGDRVSVSIPADALNIVVKEA